MGSDHVNPEDLESFRKQLSRLFSGARSNAYEANEIRTSVGPGLWQAMADPGQLEGAETALRDHKAVHDGAGMINKPFHRSELARKVRAALDGG